MRMTTLFVIAASVLPAVAGLTATTQELEQAANSLKFANRGKISPGKQKEALAAAVALLRVAGPQGIPFLERVLVEETRWELQRDVRLQVLEALEQMRFPETLPAIVIACGDENPDVRHEAIRILRERHKGAALQTTAELENRWLLDEDWFLRQGAIRALRESDVSLDDVARRAAAVAAQKNAPQRLGAIRALGQLASRESIDPLKKILADDGTDLPLRLEALGGLRHIDGREVPLQAWVLALGGDGEKILYLATLSGVYHAMNYLHQAAPKVVPVLAEALAHPDPQVRGRAAWLLGNLKPSRADAAAPDPARAAVPALRKALEDRQWYVAYQAARSLEKLDPGFRPDPRLVEPPAPQAAQPVTLVETADAYELGNGAVTAIISKKNANLSSLRKAGDDRQLMTGWGEEIPLLPAAGQKPSPLEVSSRIIRQAADGVEVCVTKRYESVVNPPDATGPLPPHPVPLEWDVHWILRPGDSGIYQYTVYRKPVGASGVIRTTRFMKANQEIFLHPYASDMVQGEIEPSARLQRVRAIGQATARSGDGRIDAKYSWCAYEQRTRVHGALGKNAGLWVIYPSTESCYNMPFANPGTAHSGYILQSHFQVVPTGLGTFFRGPEEREILCGPIFLYVNAGETPLEMWVDASRRARAETAAWPLRWIDDPAYPLDRAAVRGQVVNGDGLSAAGAWVLLCHPNPDPALAWVCHKGPYAYHAFVDRDGKFEIPHVRAGTYSVFARIDGVLGEARLDDVQLAPHETKDVGTLPIHPRKRGSLVWELGSPDGTPYEFLGSRDSREFMNWWNNYRRFFPSDVDFTIGKSNPATDWYYAQPSVWRGEADGKNRPVVWKLNFEMPEVPDGQPLLTVCSAGTRGGRLGVKLNGGDPVYTEIVQSPPHAYAADRGGAYGFDTKEISLDRKLLRAGMNTLEFDFKGLSDSPILYDYLRLEMAPVGR